MSSWTVFFIMTAGLLLLMLSVRPDLQPRPGREFAPAGPLQIAGHLLTWTTATVLGYRMVRGSRELSRSGRSDPGA